MIGVVNTLYFLIFQNFQECKNIEKKISNSFFIYFVVKKVVNVGYQEQKEQKVNCNFGGMGGFIFEENIIEPSFLLGNVIFPFLFVKKLAWESSVAQITHSLPFTWA